MTPEVTHRLLLVRKPCHSAKPASDEFLRVTTVIAFEMAKDKSKKREHKEKSDAKDERVVDADISMAVTEPDEDERVIFCIQSSLRL